MNDDYNIDQEFSVDLTDYTDSDTHKMCRDCWEYLPLEGLSKSKGSKHGRLTCCKKCSSRRYSVYAKANRGKVNAQNTMYQTTKLDRTPPWLTKKHKFQIGLKYELAANLTDLFGEPYEVDHIIPLRGKKVCGLHVPWNLQVITKAENCSKGNRL